MLFDLQSPGRRRIIKVVYALLAILLAVGLVGFGIGSDATGGLSEIFTGGSGSETGFEDEIEDAEKRAEQNPRNANAQLELVTLQIQQGNQQLEADEATGQTRLTPEAAESYGKAADAWAAYLKLDPRKPDTGAAIQLANSHFLLAQNADTGTEARTEMENAADAQQVAVDADPSRGNLGNLALYLYFAGDIAAGDKVADRALAETPKDDREASAKQFDQLREQAEAFAKQIEREQKQGAASSQGNPLGGGAVGGGAVGGGALGTP